MDSGNVHYKEEASIYSVVVPNGIGEEYLVLSELLICILHAVGHFESSIFAFQAFLETSESARFQNLLPKETWG